MKGVFEHRPARRPDLEARARAWLVHLHSGRADDASRAAAAAWRHRSADHEAAWQRARAVWDLIGEAAAPTRPLPAAAPPSPSRRRRPLPWAGALAAALLIAALLPWRVWSADQSTGAGEIRSLTLSDGSTLTLNGDSAVNLDFSDGHRRVSLVHGEAWFHVTHDADHPFVVRAGDARVRVTGTRFDLQRDGDGNARLVVQQGTVVAGDGDRQATLSADRQIRWSRGRLGAPSPVDAARALAWRHRRLIFRDRTLAEVIRALDRQHPDRLILLNHELAGRRISGVFNTRQPDAALDAVTATLPLRIRRFPGLILLY